MRLKHVPKAELQGKHNEPVCYDALDQIAKDPKAYLFADFADPDPAYLDVADSMTR